MANKRGLIFLSVFALTACAAEGEKGRPSFYYPDRGYVQIPSYEEESSYRAGGAGASGSVDYVSFGGGVASALQAAGVDGYAAYKAPLDDEQALPASCGLGDRFDRSEEIAYQWGQNRLGLDVDRAGASFKGFMLTYRLKFQDHKTKKERCRYKSSWQGLIGSGYNELFLREKNTVWDELNLLEGDVRSRLDTLLQN